MKNSPFDQLSDELMLHIFERMDISSLLKAAQVNKNWRALANDDQVWNQKIKEKGNYAVDKSHNHNVSERSYLLAENSLETTPSKILYRNTFYGTYDDILSKLNIRKANKLGKISGYFSLFLFCCVSLPASVLEGISKHHPDIDISNAAKYTVLAIAIASFFLTYFTVESNVKIKNDVLANRFHKKPQLFSQFNDSFEKAILKEDRLTREQEDEISIVISP